MAEYKTVKTSLKNILKYEADEQVIMDAVLTGHKLVHGKLDTESHWWMSFVLAVCATTVRVKRDGARHSADVQIPSLGKLKRPQPATGFSCVKHV
jgi:hypothetical protein